MADQYHDAADPGGAAVAPSPRPAGPAARTTSRTSMAMAASGQAGAGPLSGGRWEERLRGAGSEVAGQSGQDQRPGLSGVSEVDLGIPSAEAVVPEQDAGSGLGPRGLTELPLPGRALPEREARADAHADELARLGCHVGQQIHRGLR